MELVYKEDGTSKVADVEYYRSLLLLAGISYTSEHYIRSGYYASNYPIPPHVQPWLLVFTEWGPIQLGWRKRVIEIDWRHGRYKNLQILEKEDVTNMPGLIHAWDYPKAVKYLKELKLQFERQDWLAGLSEEERAKATARFASEKAERAKWDRKQAIDQARRLLAEVDAEPQVIVSNDNVSGVEA